jgi:hypothetical protein
VVYVDENNFLSIVAGLFMNCDTMLGGQFENGLAHMKAVSEVAGGGDGGEASAPNEPVWFHEKLGTPSIQPEPLSFPIPGDGDSSPLCGSHRKSRHRLQPLRQTTYTCRTRRENHRSLIRRAANQ